MNHRPFFLYGDAATPPDDSPDEPERDDPEQAQDEYERAAAECDERAPWPGDPERPFTVKRERVKVGGAR